MAFKFLNYDIFSSQIHSSKHTFRTAYVNARELLKRGLWGIRTFIPALGTPLHTGLEVHPASYPLGKGGFPRDYSGRWMMPTARLRIEPK